MYVNTKIVNALLTLRAVSLQSLAGVTGISYSALAAWLTDSAADNDERLPFERQLEVIKVLGIVGDHPRSDITHSWYLHEPAFGDRAATYEPLRLMLACFGRCEVTHMVPECDPFMSLTARTHFGLTFEKFRAVLEVRSSPLRSLAFDPTDLLNLAWVGEEAPLIVSDATFANLVTPGETTPAALDRARLKALAPARWAKLAQLAEERGLDAPALAHHLIENYPVLPALTHTSAVSTTKPKTESNDLFFGPGKTAPEPAPSPAAAVPNPLAKSAASVGNEVPIP